MSVAVNHKFVLEVCVDSVESALAVQEGGAHRVELCADLLAGGTTPSTGMIALARKHLQIGLHVMIRPRGGDFCYTDLEFNVIQRDILAAKQFGADGVVFGILKSDNTVNIERTRELVEFAKPMSITFHRAFNLVADTFQALDDIVGLEIDRILTSGQAETATEGIDLISKLVEKATGRIIIMPTSGINQHNICTILEQTGVREIHVGKAVTKKVEYSHAGMYNSESTVVDAGKVGALLEVVSIKHFVD